ncbi:MAG: CHAD domain-containing protein [Actinobacteria bacterium]|nr:MAG: CHAD domain-containing protein [Actinomycetota bacterium]
MPHPEALVTSLLGPDTPAAIAAAVILAAKAEPLFALEAAAASGEDMEAVHDMRVASRRLRAAMAIFRPLYPDREWRRFNRMARAITRSLGTVRDADVFVDEFARLTERARTTDERVTLACIIGHRLGERLRDLESMRETLATLGLAERRDGFLAFVRRGDAGAYQPLGELADAVVRERLTAVYAHLPEALESDAGETQHSMRIAVKRLRYAIETLRPCFTGKADKVLETLKTLQDVLGELHDRDVFLSSVREMAESGELAKAGVKGPGLRAVERHLLAERAGFFDTFAALTAEWDEARMTRAVLGALRTDAAPDAVEPEADATP